MLTITNLSVQIDSIQVISKLNLLLKPNSIHVLMGPNGSGKSSLAHTLMGDPRYVITEGTLVLDTQDITKLSPDKRAHAGLFLAFQYPFELPGVSVFTCLKEAYALLTKNTISVPEFQKILFETMDLLHIDHSFIDRNFNEGFSGGEKKRFELLQMFLFRPKIAILDEIDSGLDVDALKCVADGIAVARQHNPGLTLLVITHYQRLLEYIIPDYVHVMQQGIIIESGNEQLALKIDQQGYREKQ